MFRFVCLAVMVLSLSAMPALAQTTAKNAWVRGTVAQQKSTAMFGQLTSMQGGKLVAASSPVAGVVEIHEMSMDGNVMKMRTMSALDLPAGKTVELTPSGIHVMLIDLKQALKEGDVVPLSLVVEGKDGKRETIDVRASVRALGKADAGEHSHHGHKH